MLSGMADFILFMAEEYSIVCVCVSHHHIFFIQGMTLLEAAVWSGTISEKGAGG